MADIPHNKMKIIDPHLHLFNLEQGEYTWLSAENPPFWPDKNKLNRSFLESDLSLNDDISLAGFVHIEAGFNNKKPWQEIAWLEQKCQLPFRSVAYIDICQQPLIFKRTLTSLLSYKSVVGCRYILDENAKQLLSNKTVQTNLALLSEHQLSFDVQMSVIDSNSLSALLALMNALPDLVIILNHGGVLATQTLKSEHWPIWQFALKKLSLHPNCLIKCSGWEMQSRTYSISWQSRIIDECLQSFGENRTLLASNFPLCTLSKPYHQLWHEYLSDQSLSQNTLNKLGYSNALHWYQFNQ